MFDLFWANPGDKFRLVLIALPTFTWIYPGYVRDRDRVQVWGVEEYREKLHLLSDTVRALQLCIKQ